MQAIAGIPYCYGRFGYEMTVYMGEGRPLPLGSGPPGTPVR